MKPPRKVALAYSGGLDTSVILSWLIETYGCEVVCFTADIGQGEEIEPARRKAEQFGAAAIFLEDLRETFARDFVWPLLRANAVYECDYLLGTSIARPLIGKRLVEIARETGCDAVAHGATGKGNDQVRFELAAYALAPDIRVVAPWREWDLNSRAKLLAWAAARGIPVEQKRKQAAPYSMDANLLHISYEGGELEDPGRAPDESMWQRTVSIAAAPDCGETIEIRFARGDAVAIDGTRDDSGRDRRRTERARRAQRRRTRRHRRKPLCRNEIARLLRNAGRRDFAARAPRVGIDHARPRSRAAARRSDAALRRACL